MKKEDFVFFDIQELPDIEKVDVNGGGPAFEWLGKMAGRIGNLMDDYLAFYDNHPPRGL